VRRCPECAREIDESATTCDACAAWAASLLPESTESEPAPAPEPTAAEPPASAEPPPSANPAPPSRRVAGKRRELIIASMAVGGAALMTFALLMVRGGAASNVSAAAPATAAKKPSAPAPSPSVNLQRWTADTRGYWTGNQRHAAAFELQADNIVQTWFGPVRPSLVVRCMARTVQTFVYTGSAMKIEPHAEGKTVTVSVDDEPVRQERWPDSDGHDALFAPDGAAFAQRLLQAQTLRFGYTPHNSNDVVAQFHVSGLADLIDPVAKECGWAK
jgi:hypothetical protein